MPIPSQRAGTAFAKTIRPCSVMTVSGSVMRAAGAGRRSVGWSYRGAVWVTAHAERLRLPGSLHLRASLAAESLLAALDGRFLATAALVIAGHDDEGGSKEPATGLPSHAATEPGMFPALLER